MMLTIILKLNIVESIFSSKRITVYIFSFLNSMFYFQGYYKIKKILASFVSLELLSKHFFYNFIYYYNIYIILLIFFKYFSNIFQNI